MKTIAKDYQGLLILLLLMLPLFVSGVEKPERNDLKSQDLKGHVKKVTMYEQSFHLVSKLFYKKYPPQKSGAIIERYFDENGNLTQELYYSAWDTVLYSKSSYLYNKSGNLIRLEVRNVDGKYVRRHLLTYDAKDNLIEEDVLDSSKKTHTRSTKYFYDSESNKILEQDIWNGQIHWADSFFYGPDKKLLFVRQYDSTGKLSDKVSYIQNSHGIETLCTNFYPQKNTIQKDTFIYNKKGLNTLVNGYTESDGNKFVKTSTFMKHYVHGHKTKTVLRKNGKLYWGHKFKHFDKQGNWQDHFEFYGDGEANLIHRVIEYY